MRYMVHVAHVGRKRIGYKVLVANGEDEGSSVCKVSYHYCSFIC